MTAQIRLRDAGGTLRTVARIRMRDDTGTLRTIQRVRVRDASGTLRTVFQYFTVSATSPISESGSTSTITTSAASVVTVTGGSGPFTYFWANIGGDAIAAVSPTSSSSTFRKTATLADTDYIASFVCTVTDSTGLTMPSNTVTVSIFRST